MKTIEKTIEFIKEAHKDVFDKGGTPYWLHPYTVYKNLGDDATKPEKLAALLHDVVEDTDYTYFDLIDMGYCEEVIEILKLVTKEDDDFRPYHIWIKEIVNSGNHSAIKVKKADMEHNKDPKRLKAVEEKRRIRMERKYRKGWKVIMEYEKTL